MNRLPRRRKRAPAIDNEALSRLIRDYFQPMIAEQYYYRSAMYQQFARQYGLEHIAFNNYYDGGWRFDQINPTRTDHNI